MNDFFARLKERRLVQWSLAYIAAAFAFIQVLDVIAQRFGWPDQLEKSLIPALGTRTGPTTAAGMRRVTTSVYDSRTTLA